MSRYIDADAVIEKKWQAESEACFYALEDVVSVTDIEEATSIDIVRCKECKHASDNNVYGCMCNHFNDNGWDYHRMYANDFCSRGERKESE